MNYSGTNVNTHSLFQFGNINVIVVKCLNIIGSCFIQIQLRIKDIQIDTNSSLIADPGNLKGFFGFIY